MTIKKANKSKLINFLDQGIIVSAFIFALGALTSKAATSIGLGLGSLLWLIRIIVTEDYNFNFTRLNKLILFFLAGVLISGLDVGVGKFLEDSNEFFLVILFYYALINTIQDLDLVKKLSYVALFSMSIGVGYGFYEKIILNINKIDSFSFNLSFGCLLGMFLMFTISYLLWGEVDGKQRLILLLMTGFMLVSLLWTQSRGAWLGFIGASFSLAWLKDKRIVIALLIVALIIPFFLPSDYVKDFKSSFDLKGDRSNLGRLALWKGSWLMFKDHFINGIGHGYFTPVYKGEYRQPNTTNAAHAHNNFIHFLATTGTIGFIAFCCLVLGILKVLYDGYRKIEDKNWSLFMLASLAAMIMFHLQGLTEYNFHDSETLRFFWFLLALDTIIFEKLIGSDKGEN